MSDWLELLARWATAGATAGISLTGGIWFVRWLLEWLGGRMDKRADRIDRSTQQLLDRLEKEIADLRERHDIEVTALRERVTSTETALAECQERHAESEAKVLRLEAIVQGFGDAKQIAQLIISAEKQEKAK